MSVRAKAVLPIALVAFAVVVSGGCVLSHGQRYQNLITHTPVKETDILIIGFMGGREPWNNDTRGVRQLALKLRATNDASVHVETIENTKRSLAMSLIRNAL